jgi:hypothetical protein
MILIYLAAGYFGTLAVIMLWQWLEAEVARESAARDRLPEMTFRIVMEEVRAIPRKLKATWSLEAVDNLRELWGPDLALELVKAAEAKMQHEIERAIRCTVAANSIVREVFADWPVYREMREERLAHSCGYPDCAGEDEPGYVDIPPGTFDGAVVECWSCGGEHAVVVFEDGRYRPDPLHRCENCDQPIPAELFAGAGYYPSYCSDTCARADAE